MELKPNPWWTDKAIEAVDGYLQSRPAGVVFEWGSGGSTLWLEARSLALRTVEHDPEWAKKVEAELSDLGRVIVHPLGSDYVKAIEGRRGEIYDLVAIDGRMRVECVVRGAPYVRHGGMLLLDDNQRERYAKAREYLAAWQSTDHSDGERTTTIYHRPDHAVAQIPENPNLPPFFIPTRDRWKTLSRQVHWLRTHGMPASHIHLIDMGSTYRPMLDYLESQQGFGLNVEYFDNLGARHLFRRGSVVEKVVGRRGPFFLSDPDVIPATTCRLNLLEHLVACVARYRDFAKVGLSLEVEDLPDHFPFKKTIEEWESRYWVDPPFNAHLYSAAIATTFCLVRSLGQCDELGYTRGHRNGRTVRPDIGMHEPWYLDPNALPDDERYYYEHAPRRPVGGPVPGTSYSLTDVEQGWTT